ncbi:dienelactone hydrolase family protein [Streptomyces sp. NPDC101225]|uniref:dienelactone hydrolase family protein n=1 Tax=Streptomyces sp. NPDC101225 TaxID=3366135 RepID=UPI00382F690E
MEMVFPRIDPVVAPVSFGHGSHRLLPVAQVDLGHVPRGAAIVLCDAGALERDAAEVMNALAEHGYESVAVDLSGADGAYAVSDRDLVNDVSVLLGRLGERGWTPEQVGLIGYGAGGRTALLAAAEYELGAAVSIAPTGGAGALSRALPPLVRMARPVVTPWLGLFGEQDEETPPTAVQLLGSVLSESPVYTELISYSGVSGNFYHDTREILPHSAAFDAWQRTVEWLDLRVAPRQTPLAEKWRQRAGSARGESSRV